MKKNTTAKAALAAAVLMIILSAMVLTGCAKEETYTVWIESTKWENFEAMTGSELSDENYVKVELAAEQFEYLKSRVKEEEKHEWTKNDIAHWMRDTLNLDDFSAIETAWITTVEHGILVGRNGDDAYLILK